MDIIYFYLSIDYSPDLEALSVEPAGELGRVFELDALGCEILITAQ